MTKSLAQDLRPGDVIMPPAREVRLWMRRTLAERDLPESALYLTVTNIKEGVPDARGRWMIITADQTPEWLGSTKPIPFRFKARPETSWPKIDAAHRPPNCLVPERSHCPDGCCEPSEGR